MKARPRIPPEKKTGETVDRRQNNGSVKAVSPRHCAATSALRNCCFNCRVGQSHKDSFRCTAVQEQPEAKEVQLSQPSSTSMLMISSGLTGGSSPTSLLLISSGTLVLTQHTRHITYYAPDSEHWFTTSFLIPRMPKSLAWSLTMPPDDVSGHYLL